MISAFLKHRNRITFINQLKLIFFQLKRQFKIKNSPEWYGLKEYFIKLIHVKGKQVKEDSFFYYTKIKDINFKLRKRPSSDISVFGQIFEEEEYRIVLSKYIECFKTEPQTIIDAGSNIGLTSLYFYNKLKEVKLICIEPDSENFNILKYNTEANNVNAIILKAGLWHKNTNLSVINDFRDKKEWSIRVKESTNKGLKAITVNTLVTNYSWSYIDILKIDIEGAEKEVFTAKDADVSFLNKTKCIAIEIHDEFNCREDISEILKAYHFDCFNAGELTIGVNRSLLK